MGKTLYLECSSGISGDMTVAALLDLGASEERLRADLATLPVANEFSAAVSRVTKSGLDACDFDVRLDAEHENHDHDMAWLFGRKPGEDTHEHGHAHGEGCHHEHDHHGHEHEHDEHDHAAACGCDHKDHAHDHGHDEGCHHEHDHHGHEHVHVEDGHHDHAHDHGHHHAHRTLAEVTAIIDASGLSDHAKGLALAIFRKLAEAEATVHGATPETVHFHEVGATDSIVDICSVAICLDDLGVTEVVVPNVAEGTGTIRCAHGIMPVPVPAVVALCQASGITLSPTGVQGELVTPTGAAIVAALRTGTELPARYRIDATGYGAGKRPYAGCSGLLRAQLVEALATNAADDGRDSTAGVAVPAAQAGSEACLPAFALPFPTEEARVVTKLECDLDDVTGEAIGHVIGLLMDAGARDAHAIPTIMKKGRPGLQLQVVCDESKAAGLERIIFEHTTTIGIRSSLMRRDGLVRRMSSATTAYGEVATKVVTMPDGTERAYPEYDSVVAASARTGASFQDVFRAALAGGANE